MKHLVCLLLIILTATSIADYFALPKPRNTSTRPVHTKEQPLTGSVYIPSLKLTLPMEEAPIIVNEWQIKDRRMAFYGQGSARPGNKGTTVIFGHAKQRVFATLPLLQVGNTINIITKNTVFAYTVTDKKFVDPLDTSFITTTEPNRLAIFTCFGPKDAKRIVFFGNLTAVFSMPKKDSILYQI